MLHRVDGVGVVSGVRLVDVASATCVIELILWLPTFMTFILYAIKVLHFFLLCLT